MKMNTLTPSLSACCIMLFVAGVGYAEAYADVSVVIVNHDSEDLQEIKSAASGEDASQEDIDESKDDSADESAELAKSAEAELPASQPASQPSAGKELSIAPSSHVTYPEDRPSWVNLCKRRR